MTKPKPKAKAKAKRRPRPAGTGGPFSFREFARFIGVNHSVVNKSWDDRLGASITYVGARPMIKDLAMAKAEWDASRRPRVDDDDGGDHELLDHRGDQIPDYKASRAKRELHLAEIAEAEARRITGGSWVTAAEHDALKQRFLAMWRYLIFFLRRRLPLAVHSRCNLQALAKLAAVHNRGLRHSCRPAPDAPELCDEPLPITDEHGVFRLAMTEVENASDDVITELAELIEQAGGEIDVSKLPVL